MFDRLDSSLRHTVHPGDPIEQTLRWRRTDINHGCAQEGLNLFILGLHQTEICLLEG